MAQQTQMLISYGTSSQATLAIPPALINTNTGVTDYSTAIRNLALNGGFFLPNTTIFVPWAQVTAVQAQ